VRLEHAKERQTDLGQVFLQLPNIVLPNSQIMDQIAGADGIPIRDLRQIIRRIPFEAQGMFAERVEGVVQMR
jgi:hypothetical protein